jgi:hypothetical protein
MSRLTVDGTELAPANSKESMTGTSSACRAAPPSSLPKLLLGS